MRSPQGGIFALGTSSHAYLEFDVAGGRDGRELVAAVSSMREPRTTMGGVNLVAGFRPELWRSVAPDDAPPAWQGSTPTWPARTVTSCRGRSTTPCCGCREAPTT